jgi:nucleotide-binding universal stress UspA family protein
MKKILLTTDASVDSARAVAYAELIAKAQGTEVLIVQAVEPPMMTVNEDYEGGMAFQQTIDMFTELADSNLSNLKAAMETAGIKTRTFNPFGSAAGEIMEIERVEQPDMVVMATHGRTGLARFTMGSVADRVVRYGTTPVLLIREEAADPRLESAVVMLDRSNVGEAALKGIELLAGHPLHHVKLFTAVADEADRVPAHDYLEGVAMRMKALDLEVEMVTEVGDPAVLFERVAQRADFIAMGTHGRGGINRLRHGSVAERVVRASKKPVLLARAGTLDR